MKRLPIGLAVLLALAAILGLAPAASADTNDFTFASYTGDLSLDVDGEGRSTLETVETFVAEFPDSDQNHGMKRAIPTSYEGHPVDVELVSVTDEKGRPRPFETDTDDGFLVVTSAGADFVHGRQGYVFTYRQHNVTMTDEKTGLDEFQWDTNGTGWAQPFGSFTARVHIAEGLSEAIGPSACYRGVQGSTARCDLARSEAGGATVFTVEEPSLGAGENVTVAIGFAPGTFVARDDSYFASAWGLVQLIGGALALTALVLAAVLRATRLRDAPGRPTIIAEYAPPPVSVFTAAGLVGKPGKATAAAFIDLVVRGVARLSQTEEERFLLGTKTRYLLTLLDPEGRGELATRRRSRPLSDDERAFVSIVFDGGDAGTERDLSVRDTAFGRAISAFVLARPAAAVKAGYRARRLGLRTFLLVLLAFLGVIVAIIAGTVQLSAAHGGIVPVIVIAGTAVAVVATIVLLVKSPVTARGAELRDHLKGLELYIRLAEADRLRVLQSPGGAERAEASGQREGAAGEAEAVLLYERLLPYAVLFGLEREWATVLGEYYERLGSEPEWYSGQDAFSAAFFASSVSSFSSAMVSSYSGSDTSSSSGGSSGGGSSGGGGGGGGGGGV